MVIKPMPVNRPSMENSCQNSGRGSRANPLMSRCGDSRFLSDARCLEFSRSSAPSMEDLEMREECSSPESGVGSGS